MIRRQSHGEFTERIAALRETRTRLPELARNRFVTRHRRALVPHDGRMLLIAADHPARGALGVRGDPMAMANRVDLLRRLVIALEHPDVDGVVATADVLDDLLMLELLDDKLVIGSMNRGGLQGAVFELDDRMTALDVASIAGSHLDGGKMLCRIDLNDPGTAATLEACGHAITGLAGHGLMTLIEPFWSRREGDRIVNDLSTEAVIRSIAVVSGLGARSSYTWLKLPVIDGLDEVMEATTMPALLLGGDPSPDPDATYESWQKALTVPGVRGLVMGRALLYPSDGDVEAAVEKAAVLVHGARRSSGMADGD